MTLKHKFNWTYTLIAGITSLTLFSVGWIVFHTAKDGKLNLLGLILFLYFLTPVGVYVALFGFIRSLFPKLSDSIPAQISISVAIYFPIIAIWAGMDGGYNYMGIGFISYWIQEAKAFAYVALYFAVTIPWLAIKLNGPQAA